MRFPCPSTMAWFANARVAGLNIIETADPVILYTQQVNNKRHPLSGRSADKN